MKRIEELTLKWLDGGIIPEEGAELDALLADDPEARRIHIDLCNLEAALRSQAQGLDVVAATMIQVEADGLETEPEAESGRLASSPALLPVSKSPASSAPNLHSAWSYVLAVSMMLAVGFVAFRYLQLPIPIADAQIGHVTGGVSIIRSEVPILATNGFQLQANDLVNVPEKAIAAIHYDDGTRIVLASSTRIRLLERTRTGGASKSLDLQKGALTAHVKKQAAGKTLLIATPPARFGVLGTRFTLHAEAQRTRLDVIEGRVRASATNGSTAINVGQGQYAIAAVDIPLVASAVRPRTNDGLIAAYQFDEGEGIVVRDVATVGPPLDLRINNLEAVQWLPTGGLRVQDPTILATTHPAKKIVEACRKSGELTVEAWVKPTRPSQSGPARIVTLSRDTSHRNFTLGHGGDVELNSAAHPRSVFIGRVRTSETKDNGLPELHSADNSVAADLAHLVYTRDVDGTHRLYVDGIERSREDRPGDLSSWVSGYRLGLANEFTGDRPWMGEYFRVGIYSRALSAEETLRNFRAGPAASLIDEPAKQ